MIISETVIIILNSYAINYYRNKGYDLAPLMHKNDKGKLVVIMNSKLEVRVSDLPPRSNTKVLCACDKCGKERWLEFDKMTDLCHDCALKEESYRINNGNANRGKKRTYETKQKMSKIKKGKYTRENSWLWDSEKSEEDRLKQQIKSRRLPGYDEWRLEVFKKYEYRCQKCDCNNCGINAHHIESYFTNEELRLDINNGIVLCRKHHREFHSMYGKTGNTRDQLEEYLNNDIENINFQKMPLYLSRTRQGVKNKEGHSSSKYVGVRKYERKKTNTHWAAKIIYHGKNYLLGYFDTEEEAALAYNQKAIELYGEKAKINVIETQKEID